MNRKYILDDRTAQLLFDAAFHSGDFDAEVAANTLAAQNESLR